VNKLRWGKFYWSDWADDPALALCSLAAQGLWMRLLCIAAQGSPYGHVTVNGKAPSMDDLAKLIRPKPKPTTIGRLIAELEHRGVVERDACGCLVSRRMESDGKLAVSRSAAANNRWKAAGKAGSGSDLHMQNVSEGGRFASTESTETQNPKSPPIAPRKRGARGRDRMNGGGKESRNGFADIAADMIREHDDEANDARQGGARVVDLTRHLGSRKHQP
jgi:hypothetical protein